MTHLKSVMVLTFGLTVALTLSFKALAQVTITVTPSGGDDTATVQAAFSAATSGGLGCVVEAAPSVCRAPSSCGDSLVTGAAQVSTSRSSRREEIPTGSASIPSGLSYWWRPVALLVAAAGVGADGQVDKPPELISEVELWQEYYGWRSDGDIEKAHEVAVQLMDISLKLHGQASVGFGRALAEVGVTEVLLGRHADALQNLVAAEEILKERAPLYSEKLLSALGYLGSALQSNGRHREAIQAFSRAQHLTHRLWGTNNMQQIRISYAKADSLQAMGNLDQAEQLQRHAYGLYRTNFGKDSPEAIDASARFGTWLRSTGEYHGSIQHFGQALADLQGKGPDLPEAFPLLNGLAHAYRGGYRGKYARGAHQRILDLIAAHPGRFSLDQRIEAHLDYGDWLMQRFYERKAVVQYEAAWQLADDGGAAGHQWLEEFTKPKMVRYGAMAPHDIDGDNRFVTFQFDLTADGRTRRVKVTEYDCDGRDQYNAKRSFPDEIRYRPSIVEGRAVARAGHTETMYLLAPGTILEPEPVAAPARKTASLVLGDLLFEPSDIPVTEPQKDDRS